MFYSFSKIRLLKDFNPLNHLLNLYQGEIHDLVKEMRSVSLFFSLSYSQFFMFFPNLISFIGITVG